MDKKEILSDWFSWWEKPRRKGVYQTKLGVGDRIPILYSYWDGKVWFGNAFTKEHAVLEKHIGTQNKLWKGLIRKERYDYEY